MWMVSLLSYIDRNTLAILAPVILRDTHLTAAQYGLIISCFSIAYTIGNPVWGLLLDRIGVRRGMTAAVGIWTVASAAHAFAASFWTFGLARAVLGAGEGATFPGALRTVTRTLPPSKRGRGLAIAYSGGSLGAMITPLIVTPVAAAFGWHGAFLFTGLLGTLWLIFWRITARGVDHTADLHPVTDHLPLRRLTAHPAFWAYVAAYGVGAVPLSFVLYFSSLYLKARFGWTQTTLGEVLWIPPAGWECGYFIWGALVDKFATRGSPAFRGLMLAACLFSLPVVLLPWLPTGPAVLACMFVTMFGAGGFVVVSVAGATRAFPAGHSALLAGIGAGAWGAATALVLPGFGYLFDRAEYAAAFGLTAVFPVAGYLVWRWLSTRTGPVPQTDSLS